MSAMIEARIVERTDWADGLMTLTLDRNGGDFQPGQFFNLGLEVEGETLRRSYSAASAPGAPLEFFLSRVPGGALTEKVFSLAAGDSLLLDPTALGFFTLKEVPESKALWLFSTGTGLGPYISMLRQGDIFSSFEKIVIAHGVRHASHLAYETELRELETTHPTLSYLPVLSGEGEVAEGALSGRLTTTFESEEIEKRLGTPFSQDSHLLLCGNPAMITEMSDLLKARGFEKHRRRKPGHFNFERYW